MIDKKKLTVSLLIPFCAGVLGWLLTDFSNGYESLIKPAIAPPDRVFPIVWSVLYLLMGISLYLVWNSKGDKTGVYLWFFVQLILNILWPPVFFTLGMRFPALIILIMMIVAVILNIRAFSSVSKAAGYLLIPYLIWLIFAGVLNYLFLTLNN